MFSKARSKSTFDAEEVREIIIYRHWDSTSVSKVKHYLLEGKAKDVGQCINDDNLLHLAMAYDAPTEIVEILVERIPQAAAQTNRTGQLPLHCGMLRRAKLESIKVVLEACPEATLAQDNHGKSPLHCGTDIFEDQCWHEEAIQVVLNRGPQAAILQAAGGYTPLHLLFKSTTAIAPLDLVKAFVKARPMALRSKDELRRTPLDMAVEQGASADILTFLLQHCPPSTFSFSQEGDRSHLHRMMQHKSISGETINAFLEAYSRAGIPKQEYLGSDKNGQTLLHFSMQQTHINGETVRALLEAYNQSGLPKEMFLGGDENGQTPLHLAMLRSVSAAEAIRRREFYNDAPLCSVNLVVGEYPEAAMLLDKTGNSPLHHCLLRRRKSSLCPTRAILKHCPQAAEVRTARKKTPLRLAIQTAIENKLEHDWLEVVSSVLNAYPGAAYVKDEYGYTPLHFVIEECSDMSFRGLVDCLLLAYPGAAEVENDAGVSPIAFLVNKCSKSAKHDIIGMSDGRIQAYFERTSYYQQLKALLKGLRDGRPLKKLCNLSSPSTLSLLFLVSGSSYSNTTIGLSSPQILVPTIDLNQELIHRWTLLEILADIDNDDASNILLQIVDGQHARLLGDLGEKNLLSVVCNDEKKTKLDFQSIRMVKEETMRKVADRAKLSNSSEKLRTWGQTYGRFLRKYHIDKNKEPKHISDTCVVVFATETRVDESGNHSETKLALKFLTEFDAFVREIEKRKIIVEHQNTLLSVEERSSGEGRNLPYVVPILSGYTSMLRDDLCEGDQKGLAKAPVEYGVNFEEELRDYKHIRLNSDGYDEGSNGLRCLLVMESGSGVDLNDVISHQNIAGKNLPVVLSVSSYIAECLQFLNEQCLIVHGDVKARNFVSLGVGARYAAIDLDCAASIHTEHMGKKRTSSGYLPPEQAAVEGLRRRKSADCSETAVNTAKTELENLEEQLDRAHKVGSFDGQLVLLQAHREATSRLKQVQTASAAIKPVIAKSQYDMWCFGVLLYYLCTGEQLFSMDFREEVKDQELVKIQYWCHEQMVLKLRMVPAGWPRSLLADLLQPNPANRPTSWSDVILKLQNVQADPRKMRIEAINHPCMWSITYLQLMEMDDMASKHFNDLYSQQTMRDIVEELIKPRCKATRTSFALSLNPDGLMVDAFITHCWDEPFQAFVSSIRKVFQTSVSKPNLWICAFALCQADSNLVAEQVGSVDTPLTSSPFVQALEHALTFVVVRNSTTDLYSRIWCVCELIYATKLGLVPHKTHVTGPDVFSHMQTSCLNAECTNPEDKTRILDVLLKEHNVDEINKTVRIFREQEEPT